VRCSLVVVVPPQPRQDFQIVTTDGRELGPMELGRPDWPVGSVIYQGGPKPNLRVVDHRESPAGPVLVVEEV
jgi:hypothetical protein